MHALEMTFLAGGAAISLLCGAATAQFGLAPLGDAFARLETKADPIAFSGPASGADGVQIREATYGYAAAPGYFSEPAASVAQPRLDVASKTLTVATAMDTGDTDDRRDPGDSVTGDEDSAPVPQGAPAWPGAAATLAGPRDGQVTRDTETDGPTPTSREADPAPEASGR